MLDKVRQRERVKKWRKDNPEKQKAYQDKYFSKPGIREKRLASTKRWTGDNLEKVKVYRREYAKRADVKRRRYLRYRKALGPGHRQTVKNYLQEEARKKYNLEHSMKHYTTRKQYLQAYKAERGCKVCGEKDYACLDYHHRDETTKHKKLSTKGTLGNSKGSWYRLSLDEVTKELTLVDVLCANCHRKLHRDEKEKIDGR